jgi:membrane-bound ClpP family serine protease
VASAPLASAAPGSGVGPALPFDLGNGATTDTQALVTECPEAVIPEAGAELTSQQAIDSGLTSELQPGEPAPSTLIDLLDQVDGKTVQTSAGPVVLHTAVTASAEQGPGVDLRYHDLGPWRRMLHAVSSPTAIYVLLVLAFAGFAFELTQPGFGFAGMSAVVALGLAGYGTFAVTPNWLGLLFLLGGFALLILDVQLRKLGVLSALGVVSFGVGSFLIYRGVADTVAIPVPVIVVTLVLTVLYYGFGLTVAQQAYQRIASTQQGLVGLTGETRGDLNPEGGVHVKGTVWRGRTVGEPIPAGTRVRVRGVDGLVLRVEPEPDDDPIEPGASPGSPPGFPPKSPPD